MVGLLVAKAHLKCGRPIVFKDKNSRIRKRA